MKRWLAMRRGMYRDLRAEGFGPVSAFVFVTVWRRK